ncbi:MAG: pyrimidine dimer DNA glycosylase [Candidatus Yanofskybacteria bacterium RIFOXYD1_FULL_44_17]|nr:MAG: pyrimidine dimer DNA glycosylase [Candidatus Yanofskybacteria bacterium RIFOXYA2_FULL_45_28]OGN36590.1 MAG: pyrimidine dimer DNA glycosylase [Candidatus Yanofskybacteria bacterium RIFOXYA1_FULL_44_17]OGN37262.1 MAG: pyrimidine dimer DNA glycosylase [Candidatus Yanofskybacteria bacterium RIFOXYB2_FULL_44_18]OGN37698.1 MAG: pyrimidine dimer DNA glycosylase [Candidatus Yanofskybacteria bacterium RIFOXYC1_FULL_44_16]OGN37822.1 MAG: pyrimidine dimer DNA glycosylase [Candidatus Yanofskybacter
MRIWDIHPKHLCRKHLLAEHRELHGLWNILTIHDGKGGYSQHPETKRWVGKLKALYIRHESLVEEMINRKYSHRSPLNKKYSKGKPGQEYLIDDLDRQKVLLRDKPCECFRD